MPDFVVNNLPAVVVLASTVLNWLVLFFWQPWAKAYSEEVARQKVRHDNLGEILTEIKTITEATKNIESRIAGDLWTRQRHWKQKRAAYGDLMTTASEMASACTWLAAKLTNPTPEFITDQSVLVERLNSINDSRDGVAKEMQTFARASAMARIFCSAECVARLDACDVETRKQGKTFNTDLEKNWAEARMLIFLGLSRDIVQIAKVDLNVA